MTSFYVANDEPNYFSDQSIVDGIGPGSRSRLSFGLFFFDYDLDGRMDLFQANGHVENEINKVQKSQNYRQSPQLFWNCGHDCKTSFIEIIPESNNDLGKKIVGRGAAFADIDNDGDLDVVLTQINDRPLLLRNDLQLEHHWLKVRLVQPGKNPDAIGAVVRIQLANGEILRREIMPTRSYLSQVLPEVVFGFGEQNTIAKLEVTWPDGTIQSVNDVGELDRLLLIDKL